MCASFTRAAVAELNTRNLPIPDQNLGTLHSLAYKSLNFPEICEVGKHFKAFNATVSTSFQLSAPSRNDVDDGYATSEGAAEGDKLLRELQRRRALMQPQTAWPEELKGFAAAWQRYKDETGTMDFTDLIEVALRDVSHPPGAPDIGFLDEAQDLTPCEMALWRKWAAGMDKIIICGDPDQAIFSFKGARAAEMLTPIPEENVRVLKQSYRVPAAVHEVAQAWIEKIPPTHRKQVEYLPRDYPGEVRHTDHHYKDPDPLVRLAEPYLEAGKTVMFLASCSYMLSPLLDALRNRGIPFSNPYRRRRLDWNPLYRPEDKFTAVSRVAAFMGHLISWDLHWTGNQLALWLPLTKGVFIRGKKTAGIQAFREMADQEVMPEQLAQYIPPETIGAALQGGAGWLQTVLGGEWQRSGAYACALAAAGGPEALSAADEPLCRVGTVHCSPPDEPILTTEGWVPIGELDRHRLVGYMRKTNSFCGIGRDKKSLGYEFSISKRFYSGPLIVLKTEKTKTRVTPSHRVLARFNDSFMEKWVVYLMKREDLWRIGLCVSAHRPYRSGGVGGRLATEQADVGWILGVYGTRREAVIAEEIVRGKYGITGLTFQTAKARALSQEDLNHIHREINGNINRRAKQLLDDYGLSAEWPLYTRSPLRGEVVKRNMRNIFVTEAANLIKLSGYVDLLTSPDLKLMQTQGKCNRGDGRWSPEPFESKISVEQYSGLVYGLDVPPHHYYVSGGNVVHNSVKGGEADCVILMPDLSYQGYMGMNDTTEGFHDALRLFYVGMTRAKETLVLASPASRMAVEW
jgi:hypothetical protein